MQIIIWIGAALSVIGLGGIIYSIIAVARAKKADLDDDALRTRLNSILPINMIGLLLSILGLMTIVVGVVLS